MTTTCAHLASTPTVEHAFSYVRFYAKRNVCVLSVLHLGMRFSRVVTHIVFIQCLVRNIPLTSFPAFYQYMYVCAV